MIHFLSINFFSWISSIFVEFFKSSRFFCVTLYLLHGWRIILNLLEISSLGEKLLASQERLSSLGLFVRCRGKVVWV